MEYQAKPKKQGAKKEHYSKSKKKFMKMVEMDEGILFPLAAGNIKDLPPQKRGRAQNTVSSGGCYNSLSYESVTTQQQNQPNSGGATTMPPIFVETKLMIV
ncbi:hypothetical protein FGO68_gene14505 [Halteria grandinella]|uniref:Uncharacterized protein n=1 Tax=Halteria grandinella TaxID=5974 RepID=A0A8J8NHE3_HALGN|nr:hypothetical protein FGO68_gene14505 [Halteria grandinella]